MHMLLLDGLLCGVLMCAGADRRMVSACLLMSQPCAEELDWVVDSPGMVITCMDMLGVSCAGYLAQGISSALRYAAVFHAVWHCSSQ